MEIPRIHYVPEDTEMPPMVEQLVDREGMDYDQAWQIADEGYALQIRDLSTNQHAAKEAKTNRTKHVRRYTSEYGRNDPYWNGDVQPTEEEKRNAAGPMSPGLVLAREMGWAIADKDIKTRQDLLTILASPDEKGDMTDDDKVA